MTLVDAEIAPLTVVAARASTVTTVDDLLADALPWSQFVDYHLGRRPLLVRGRADRYAELFRWARLNDLLAAQRLDVTRTHVVRDSMSSAVSLAEPVPQLGARGRPLRLVPERLHEALHGGATLVIDAYHELDAALRAFTRDLEVQVRAFVQTNLYVTTTTGGEAFGQHWDDHDVFVLQVAGRKRWTIFPPTVAAPIGGWDDPPRPTGEPYWEGELSDGDLLYLPRGWWHQVNAVDGPTAHLTCGARLPTGFDLLTRAVAEARTELAVRSDLPNPAATETDAASWFAEMRSVLSGLAARPNWLEQLAASVYAPPPARTPFRLPDLPEQP